MAITEKLSFLLVFSEGFLSFFSPCVLPLIPVYISYLAGNGRKINEDGTVSFDKKIVFINTLFFVVGIASTFFILGLSFSALGLFLNSHKVLFSRIGGIIIIILGLNQLELINFSFLKIEKKIHFELNTSKKMNPLTAFIMGFTFSFAWTPCVGPALSSVLILASNSGSTFMGNLLVLIYSIGFIVPFIALGLFTTELLNFFKAKRNILRYTIKIGGIILIIIGLMMFSGSFTNISRYLSY